VSTSSVVVVVPRRTLASTENPCPAISPTVVDRPRTAVPGRADAERCPRGPSVVLQQSVIRVVDQSRDHDLVDWLQRYRIDRGLGGRLRSRRGGLRRICWRAARQELLVCMGAAGMIVVIRPVLTS
jgi:hypothetical protein